MELGLGGFEGRGWRGLYYHATLDIAAYGFLVAEWYQVFPSACNGHLGLSAPEFLPHFQLCDSLSSRTAQPIPDRHTGILLARSLLRHLYLCPFCSALRLCRVEMWRGGVGSAYLFSVFSSAGDSSA